MKIKKVNELNSNIKEEYLKNKHEEIENLKKLLQQVYEDGAENVSINVSMNDESADYEMPVTFEEYWEQYGDKLILDSGILDDD